MATSDIYETTFDEDVQTDPNPSQCPECDGRVTTNAAETVCEACGLVVETQQIDHGPEWRPCDDGDRKRTGGPRTPARHDRGLSTEIGHRKDANGNPLSGQKRRQLARLRREHGRARFQSKADRNLAHGLGDIRRITGQLGLANTVRDHACSLFRSAQDEALFRGRSLEAMAAASVYGACRCHGLARTLDEVSEIAQVDHVSVQNAYRTLNTELGLPAKPMTPSEYVPRLTSELDVSDRIRQRARTLAETAEAAGVTTGVQPLGFAGACLYAVGRDEQLGLTQSQIADTADTSPQTLRKHWRTLDDLADK